MNIRKTVLAVALVLFFFGACNIVAPLDDLDTQGALDGEGLAGGAGAPGSLGEAGSGGTENSGTTGSGGSGPGGECSAGDKRCSGTTPEVCSDKETWVRALGDCAFGCKDGACQECESEGARRCNNNVVQVCSNGAWEHQDPCDKVCEAGECKDSCTEGYLQCNGKTLQECTGKAYENVEDCDFLCHDGETAGGAACVGECTPQEVRCDPEAENATQTCSAEGEWSASQACDNATFCVNGACQPCDPGSKRCLIGEPQQCSKFGQWEDQPACADPDPVCLAGACVSCSPKTKRCRDSDLEECDSDGKGWSLSKTCEGDTPACIDAIGDCGKCQENDVQCSGDNVQVCNAEGTWNTLAPCSGSTPQCVDGECKACDPKVGEKRCQDQDTAQTCQPDATWGDTVNCSGNQPVCREGSFSCGCNDGDKRCDTDGTPLLCVNGSWAAQGACNGQTPHCLDGDCVACDPTGPDNCQNSVAVTCNQQGSWVSLNQCFGAGGVKCGNCPVGGPCDDDDDCEAGLFCVQKQCAVCNPTDRDCTGNTPLVCSNAGAWVVQAACAGNTPICVGGNCVECTNNSMRSCGECNDGSQSCSGNSWGPCTGATTERQVFYDGDGDGFGDVEDVRCVGGNWVTQGGDCCDSEQDANPNATAWHASATDCGHYDWDCSSNGGAGTRRWTTSAVTSGCVAQFASCGGCCYAGGTPGWHGTIPACGGSGTYGSCLSCGWSSGSRAQECR